MTGAELIFAIVAATILVVAIITGTVTIIGIYLTYKSLNFIIQVIERNVKEESITSH